MISRLVMILTMLFILSGCDDCDDYDYDCSIKRLKFYPFMADGTPFYALQDPLPAILLNNDGFPSAINISNGKQEKIDRLRIVVIRKDSVIGFNIPAFDNPMTVLMNYDSTFSDTLKFKYEYKVDECCGKNVSKIDLFLNDTLYCSGCEEDITIRYGSVE